MTETTKYIEEIRESLEEEQGYKPKGLVHFVGGEIPDYNALEDIRETGLLVSKSNNWERLNKRLPQRPHGIFFWGDDDPRPGAHRLEVDIGDLDTEKLYAYPSRLADAVAKANAGIYTGALADALYEVAAEVEAIPYEEFAGEFISEWIYADDIPAGMLKFQ